MINQLFIVEIPLLPIVHFPLKTAFQQFVCCSIFLNYSLQNFKCPMLVDRTLSSSHFNSVESYFGNFLSTIKYCVLVHYFQQLSNEKLSRDKNRTASKLCSRFGHLPGTRESIANCSLSTGKKQQAASVHGCASFNLHPIHSLEAPIKPPNHQDLTTEKLAKLVL